MGEGTLAVLGATGYTGGLVAERARKLGVPLRLVGRRRDALERLARPGEEVRIADARDTAALAAAFEGAAAVGSCAGPFLELGLAPVEAALAAGAHYLDTSGEQAHARRIFDELGGRAAAAGVALLPCFGFDYVPGDLAARLAADGLEPLDEIAVGYALSRVASSAGTRRTIGSLMRRPLVAWQDGRLVESRFGATTRTLRFPFGERGVVEWGGTEPLTVPRHTRVRSVRSYVRAPRAAAAARPLAPLVAPLVRASAALRSGGPSPERRARARFAVVAEARGPQGGRRATLTGTDPYGLTAALVVAGAQLLAAGEARAAGAVAPVEAFDVDTLLVRVAPLLAVASVEPL